MIFIVTLLRGRFDGGLLILALAVFLNMTAQLYQISYAINYFGHASVMAAASFIQQIVSVALVIFLATRAVRFRAAAWLAAGLCVAAQAVYVLWGPRLMFPGSLQYELVHSLPETMLLLGLIAMLAMSWLQRRSSAFHRFFAPVTTACIGLWLAVQLLLPTRAEYFARLMTRLRTRTFNELDYRLGLLMTAASLAILVVQFVRSEMESYAEKKLLIERSEMTRRSYENLRLYNEEVMILRHDMNRHFQYLRSVSEDEKVTGYLDTLIGQNAKIRPVIQSGNEVLDIVIGSRAAMAAEAGVRITITRSEAPSLLPMETADLCALIMNLLDNAIRAAREGPCPEPYIRLDLHTKSGFFVFVCENSADARGKEAQTKETVPKHGLGLKIVRQIADKYGALLQMTQRDGSYKAELAILLDQPSK